LNVTFLVSYWIFCLFFYYIEFFLEKDHFFIASKTNDDKIKDDIRDIKFSSVTGLYDGLYELEIEGKKGSKHIKTKKAISVGKLFDVDGYVHLDQVEEFFKDVYNGFIGET